MNLRIAWTIFAKDLLDTLRDRRTLFMMIGVPVLLYPAIMLLSLQVAVMQHEHLERTVSRVVVDSAWLPLRVWLQEQPRVRIIESESPDADLNRGLADVIIRTPNLNHAAQDEFKTTFVSLHYDATDFESLDAALRVEKVLNDASKELLSARLNMAGLDSSYIQPIKVEQVNIAPPSKTTGNLLGLALPLLMVVMIALGAFYPAVDLTAGEKERGTFETLLSTPAAKLDIVLGKFFTVFTLAILTGLLNLGSMAATFIVMFEQARPMFEENLALEFSLPWSSVLLIVLIMLPLGGMISAIMMSIAVYARSFKEAQNYVTPFFLVLMLPAILAAMPGSELSMGTACIPILNVVLLFRALMTDAAVWSLAAIALGATVLHASMALLVAGWLFHREDVILADKAPPLLVLRKRPGLRAAPEPLHVLALYGGMAVLLFYAGGLFAELGTVPGILVTQWGLILLPAFLFLAVLRVDPQLALSLRAASGKVWMGALFMAVGGLLIMLQLGYYNNQLLPMPEAMQDVFKEMFGPAEGMGGIALMLLTVAISPAICEELLFRGVIQSGLRDRLGPVALCVVVGLLFAAFHLTIYRFFPQAVFGMLLAYVCLRGGSIYPSMFLHAFLNGSLLLLATGFVPEALASLMELERVESQGLPLPLLVSATGMLLVGVSLVERSARRATPREQANLGHHRRPGVKGGFTQ